MRGSTRRALLSNRRKSRRDDHWTKEQDHNLRGSQHPSIGHLVRVPVRRWGGVAGGERGLAKGGGRKRWVPGTVVVRWYLLSANFACAKKLPYKQVAPYLPGKNPTRAEDPLPFTIISCGPSQVLRKKSRGRRASSRAPLLPRPRRCREAERGALRSLTGMSKAYALAGKVALVGLLMSTISLSGESETVPMVLALLGRKSAAAARGAPHSLPATRKLTHPPPPFPPRLLSPAVLARRAHARSRVRGPHAVQDLSTVRRADGGGSGGAGGWTRARRGTRKRSIDTFDKRKFFPYAIAGRRPPGAARLRRFPRPCARPPWSPAAGRR